MITPIELDLLGRAEQMAEQLAGNLPVHVATCSYLARLYVLETVDLRLVCFLFVDYVPFWLYGHGLIPGQSGVSPLLQL